MENPEQEKRSQEKQSWLARLGEDWLSVIIGLMLVFLTWIGVITEISWPLLGFFK